MNAVQRRRLGFGISAAFCLAMVMGSGPGLHLINPQPGAPADHFTWWGVPKIYLWGLLWYGVQLAALLLAYFKVWVGEDGDGQ